MKLSEYLNKLNTEVPVQVVGNGYGTTNVPRGARGTVISIMDREYTIRWEDGTEENFVRFCGGMAMDLDVGNE